MTYSVALDGITGRVVAVEADVSNGVPGWSLSGLPDTCVSEARGRCRAALINSGHKWPDRRITVAMYPADVRKVGTHYDLAIALSLLIAEDQLAQDSLRGAVVFGELSLDGRLRAVPGVLPAVLAASDAGVERVVVPEANVAEAKLVEGVDVEGVTSLRQCLAMLRGQPPPDEPDYPPLHGEPRVASFDWRGVAPADLRDVRGQRRARWCVEVAAAGGHHLFLQGPPGAGKTMLAERFPALLPDLGLRQALEVSKIHSVAGLLTRTDPLLLRPPYLAPHHKDTVPSVIGGGSRTIRPGAISLAHLGTLFLDEAPEFQTAVHDALRQPLETGEISIRRAEGAARYPARFQLLLAANPCPCGFGNSGKDDCRCPPAQKRRYQAKISGPVRDRIDINHAVLPVSRAQMGQVPSAAGATEAVAERVAAARQRQRMRFESLPWATNADIPGYEFRRLCPLPTDVVGQIEDAVAAGALTQRGADRVARLAWTLADMGARPRPRAADVAEALSLRAPGVFCETGMDRAVA